MLLSWTFRIIHALMTAYHAQRSARYSALPTVSIFFPSADVPLLLQHLVSPAWCCQGGGEDEQYMARRHGWSSARALVAVSPILVVDIQAPMSIKA